MKTTVHYILLISIFVLALSTFSSAGYALDYSTIISESIPAIEASQSLNEAKGFLCKPISPNTFAQLLNNNVEQLIPLLGDLDDSNITNLSSGQAKWFTFFDVPIHNELANIVVIRYGIGPMYTSVVFVNSQGQWTLIDLLPDVQDFEVVSGITNSWLITTEYTYQYTVEIKRMYCFSTRSYQNHAISHAAQPLYNEELEDGVVYHSGKLVIDEFSVVESEGSVFHCYLYMVKNASICSILENCITEHASNTSIDIYEYDYATACWKYIKTNYFENIGSATIDSILRHDVLLSGNPLVVMKN